MARVAGGVEEGEGAIAEGYGFAVLQYADLFRRDGFDLAVDLVEEIAVDGFGAGDEFGGVEDVGLGLGVAQDDGVGAVFQEFGRAAAVVEVDVGDDEVADLLGVEFAGFERFEHVGHGESGDIVDECGFVAVLNQVGGGATGHEIVAVNDGNGFRGLWGHGGGISRGVAGEHQHDGWHLEPQVLYLLCCAVAFRGE